MARSPIHPGEHLAEELAELGISAAELARQPSLRLVGFMTTPARHWASQNG
ncbi:MAG: hypothetical protein IT508_12880 [Burkholderiaceae bacterium]|nr:hypothetical protein [Burkholderiaceae bacterium]